MLTLQYLFCFTASPIPIVGVPLHLVSWKLVSDQKKVAIVSHSYKEVLRAISSLTHIVSHLPSCNLTYLLKITIFNGKIHYFYGHFQ